MRKRSLTVYEIEHQGDVDGAVELLVKAGFTSVETKATDYEHDECAYFQVTFDDDKEFVALYDKAAELGVCF